MDIFQFITEVLQELHNYVKQGWIKRVVRGVYQRPLPHQEESEELSWQVVLLSLQQLMGYDVYLGGRMRLISLALYTS